MDKSIEDYVLAALVSWLQQNKGVDGVSWVYSHEFVGDIPKGYTASVRIELHKLGGEPKEYEKCKHCSEMHEKGKPCPYKT